MISQILHWIHSCSPRLGPEACTSHARQALAWLGQMLSAPELYGCMPGMVAPEGVVQQLMYAVYMQLSAREHMTT